MDTEYRLIAKLLDSMGMAFCVFDANDFTMLWNQSFLRYFPEHEGHLFVGEYYGDNLRRFYRGRLSDADMPNIERYVADGVQRNRTQTAPYVFQHHGRWFRASSVPESGGGRLRVWLHLTVSDAHLLKDLPLEALQLRPPTDAATLLSNLGEGATVIDAEQRIVAANDQFLHTYGFVSEPSVLGRTLRDLVTQLWDAAGDPAERALYADHLDTAHHRGKSYAGTAIELPLPGGRWTRVTFNHTADGQTYALHWDISATKRHEIELRQAERRARESEQRIRDVFTQSGMPTLLAAPDGRLIDANDALCELLHYPRDPLLELRLADIVEGNAAAALLRDLALGGARVADNETTFRRADGSSGACQVFCAAVLDGQGNCHHIVGHVLDITRRKTEEQARERMVDVLKREASQDELTGLVNRRQLEADLRTLLREPGAHGLLFIDLDGFKAINDRAGHAFGDVVLRQVAGLLRSTVRGSDVVGRLGGDEFLVLLRDCDCARVTEVAQNLVEELGRGDFGVAGMRYPVGASIGVRCFGHRLEAMATVLHDADAACYLAKQNGRNRVEVHSC